jgi:hypothetical protein
MQDTTARCRSLREMAERSEPATLTAFRLWARLPTTSQRRADTRVHAPISLPAARLRRGPTRYARAYENMANKRRSKHSVMKACRLPQFAIVAFALCSLALISSREVEANPLYPIPFQSEPDWHGIVTELPVDIPSAYSTKLRVMEHKIVLVQVLSQVALSDDVAAHSAYNLLFKNTNNLPPGAIYAVVTVFGPRNGAQVFPKYGYVFPRDARNHWRARPISKQEVDALAEVLLPHG